MRIGNFELRRIKKGKALHPDYKRLIDFAFDIEGEEFYCFKNLADMPQERYYKVSEFVTEADNKVTRLVLLDYLSEMNRMINEGNFGKVASLVDGLEYRASMLIETETMYRLASAIFFTLEEDLTTYDIDFNDQKVEVFKKNKIEDFFLKEPVSKFIPLPDISPKDLAACSKLTESVKRYDQYLLNQDSLKKKESKG